MSAQGHKPLETQILTTTEKLNQTVQLMGKNGQNLQLLQQKAAKSIQGAKKTEKLKSIESGLGKVIGGIKKINSGNEADGNEADVLIGMIEVAIGAGQFACLAFPEAAPFVAIVSSIYGYFCEGQKSNGEIIADVISKAFEKYDDDKTRREAAGVSQEFKTALTVLYGALGEDITNDTCVRYIEKGDKFMGELKYKIEEMRTTLSKQKHDDTDTVSLSDRAIRCTEMYCGLTVHRLGVLYTLLAACTENSGNTVNVVIKCLQNDLLELIKPFVKPKKEDTALISTFLPSNEPFLIAVFASFGYEFQNLHDLTGVHYLKIDGRYLIAVDPIVPSTADAVLLAIRTSVFPIPSALYWVYKHFVKPKFDHAGDQFRFESIDSSEDNLFQISHPDHYYDFDLHTINDGKDRIRTIYSSYSNGKIVKIVRVEEGTDAGKYHIFRHKWSKPHINLDELKNDIVLEIE